MQEAPNNTRPERLNYDSCSDASLADLLLPFMTPEAHGRGQLSPLVGSPSHAVEPSTTGERWAPVHARAADSTSGLVPSV